MVQPLRKAVEQLLKKLQIELPDDPAILLLSTYAKKIKSILQRDICTPICTAALVTIAKMCKQHKCSLMALGINQTEAKEKENRKDNQQPQ